MKDTAIGYDVAQHQHHHHHSQQQQQQQQHYHQQPPTWTQRQHQETHTTSIYGNGNHHHAAAPGGIHRTHVNQQQHHHHLNQYHLHQHQQIHSPGQQQQHNTSSYYQQQQQQQQQPQHANSNHLYNNSYHSQHSASNNLNSIQPQQQQQTTINAHANWTNPNSINSLINHQAVTSHSPLTPYIPPPSETYQAGPHNNNEQRNQQHSNEINHSPIGANGAPIESLYNQSIVQQTAPTYPYGNYNSNFFQQANANSQAPLTGNHHTTNISTFWNQATQPPQSNMIARLNPPQGNQSQRHEPITSDHTTMVNHANYILDPRLYYARPPVFDQSIQNFTQAQCSPNSDATLPARFTPTVNASQSDQQSSQPRIEQPHNKSISTRSQHHVKDSNATTTSTKITEDDMSMQRFSTNKSNTQDTSKPINPNLSSYNHSSRIRRNTPPTNNSVGSSKDSKSSDVKRETQINDKESSSSVSLKKSINSVEDDKVTNIYGQNALKSYQDNSNERQKQTNSNSVAAPNERNAMRSSINQNREARVDSDSHRDHRSKRSYQRNQADEVPPKVSDRFETNKQILHESKVSRQPEDNIEDKLFSLSLSSPKRTTWASIASQPVKVIQPKSLKSKISGANSVLSSSAKHHIAVAAASSISTDPPSLDLKNGLKNNAKPATSSVHIKGAALLTSTKLPTIAASLKLNLLGKDSMDTSKISWPAVNASIDLTSEDISPKNKPVVTENKPNYNENDKRIPNDSRRDDYSRDFSSGREAFWPRRVEREDYDRSDRADMDHKNSPEINNNKDASKRNNNLFRDIEEPRAQSNDYDSRIQHRDIPHRAITKRNGFMNRNEGGDRIPYTRPTKYGFHSGRNNNYHLNSNQDKYQPQRPVNQQGNNRHPEDDDKVVENNREQQNSKLRPVHLDYSSFNPKSFDLDPKDARYFIIKSYSEDDIHKSIKYSIWCSTNHGNRKLDEAYRQQEKSTNEAPIYLFFSVNGSGHFCGMAQMTSSVDFDSSTGVWAQSKWQGEFSVKWIYVKDVPNNALRHITLENNENKPVTNSRDTQEVLNEKGKAVLKIIHEYQHQTSLFDDLSHHERRHEEKKNVDERKLNYNSNDRSDNGFLNRSHNGRAPMNSRSIHNDHQHHAQYRNDGYRERPGKFVS